MVLADPVGSVLAPLIKTGRMEEAGSWTVEGIGEDFVPPNADLSLVRRAFTITDRESIAAARALLAQEGLLAGSSSGTLLAAALRYCREQTEPKRVVTFVCDSGNKYLSKVFNDVWVAEQGLVERLKHGNLRDLVAGMNALAGSNLLDHDHVERQIAARDRELDNPYSKDAQVTAIRGARNYLGDRLVRTAKPHRILDPANGPLIAVRLHILTRKTLGGIHTDLDGRVLDASGEPVPGLYAAGEVAGFGGGGYHGYNALEGTFLGGCIFSGRNAGRAAARQ